MVSKNSSDGVGLQILWPPGSQLISLYSQVSNNIYDIKSTVLLMPFVHTNNEMT